MITNNTITIYDIEAFTESEVRAMAKEHFAYKGHDIYFVDIPDSWGFSMLVFKDGHHIHYANDYALHHGRMPEAELVEWYERKYKSELFTIEELKGEVKNYNEYCNKDHYLRNLLPLTSNGITAFHIFDKKEDEQKFRDVVKDMHFSTVDFNYYDDKSFPNLLSEIHESLEKAVARKNDDFEYWVTAFEREMWNHEYYYSMCEADYEVIACFFNIEYFESGKSADEMLREGGATATQINAYHTALRRYNERMEEIEG